jgi:hypothetical protein
VDEMVAAETVANKTHVNCHGRRCSGASSISGPNLYAIQAVERCCAFQQRTGQRSVLSMTSTPGPSPHGETVSSAGCGFNGLAANKSQAVRSDDSRWQFPRLPTSIWRAKTTQRPRYTYTKRGSSEASAEARGLPRRID